MNQYKSNIWKIYVFEFLISLHFIGGVLVPFFLDWGKISFTQVMILQSIFVFSIFLLEVPTGAVADCFGRKISIILSAIVITIAVFVYSFYPNFYVFILGEFLWALSFALMSGADEALIYDSLKKIKKEKTSKKVLGRFRSFSMMGIMIGAPIGSIIAANFGLRYTMMLMAVPFFIAFLFAFSFKEPKIKKKKQTKKYFEVLVSGVKYFKEHRTLKILAFDGISIYILAFLVIWTYQPLLKQLNFPLIYFGFVHAAMAGLQILFMSNFEILEKIFRSKKSYLFYSAIIVGFSFVLLGIISYIPIVIFFVITIAAFGLSRFVLIQNYMHKYIESHNRATVISSVSMVEKLCVGIVYPIIGLFVEWSLNYTLIIIGFVAVLFALISRVEEEHLID